jgi:hypothetical protein
MDWQNATRARLHLETVEDAEGSAGRVLEVKKTNYGPCGEKLKLRWEDGCFVLESTASSPAQAAAANVADRAYLDCLDVATEQGRNVFASTGRGYAPRVFAEMPQANGITARALKAAQERLFSAGTIHNEPYGPASRNSRRMPGNTNHTGYDRPTIGQFCAATALRSPCYRYCDRATIGYDRPVFFPLIPQASRSPRLGPCGPSGATAPRKKEVGIDLVAAACVLISRARVQQCEPILRQSGPTRSTSSFNNEVTDHRSSSPP